jgi:uncharacterized membrane protein SirB2
MLSQVTGMHQVSYTDSCMNRFIRITLFILGTILLTGGLSYLVRYIYFSDFSRAFDVVGIFFALIIYSNFVAKMYGYTQKRLV